MIKVLDVETAHLCLKPFKILLRLAPAACFTEATKCIDGENLQLMQVLSFVFALEGNGSPSRGRREADQLGGGALAGGGIYRFKEPLNGAKKLLRAVYQVYDAAKYDELCRQAGVSSDRRSYDQRAAESNDVSYAQRHSGRGRKTVDDVVLEITRSRTGVSLTASHPLYIVEYYREALRPLLKRKSPAEAGPNGL